MRAVCQACQRPIGCTRFYQGEWRHADDENAPLTSAELAVLERVIRSRPQRVMPSET